MADNKTTAQETAASALTGAELIRGVQSGGNVKITTDQIKDFATAPSQSAISASEIDWAAASSFYKTLGADTVFTFANAADGMQVVVAITGASTYTVTWPTVKWTGGIVPVQSTGAKTDVYTFVQINGAIYGSALQDMA